jgi:hypothetical protein
VNPIFQAALEIQQFFEAKKWRFCFFGGLATLRWGEMRTTEDVDINLLTAFGEEQRYIAAILERFKPRFAGAGDFALQSRTLLIKASNEVDIDVSLAAFPFEEDVVERSSSHTFGSAGLRLCSAEDLIIYKVFAGRDKDWGDVSGIIQRQKNKLDWTNIENSLPELLEIKGKPEHMERLIGLKLKYEKE